MTLGFALMVGVDVARSRRRRRAASTGCSGASSSCRRPLYSLGHGTNDAQKTMGIIAGLLFATGHLGAEFYVPFWVVLAAHAAHGARARWPAAGGSSRRWACASPSCKPVGGFCAETAGALMLIGTAVAGIPVSTTHTITGAIVGVGATTRLSAVRWGVAGRIVWAWILTIPAAALIAGVSSALLGWLR